MKCGVSRVRMTQGEETDEALTREDIRGLIQKGVISSVQKKGTSKFGVKRKLEQKKKGRMKGPGKRKGTKGARKNDKTQWMEKVRPLRKLLADMRESGQITKQDYGTLYRRVKGGFFRNRKHILFYMKENEMLKSGKREASEALKKSPRAVKRAAQAKPSRNSPPQKGEKKGNPPKRGAKKEAGKK